MVTWHASVAQRVFRMISCRPPPPLSAATRPRRASGRGIGGCSSTSRWSRSLLFFLLPVAVMTQRSRSPPHLMALTTLGRRSRPHRYRAWPPLSSVRRACARAAAPQLNGAGERPSPAQERRPSPVDAIAGERASLHPLPSEIELGLPSPVQI